MTELDEALAELRADAALPDPGARQRIAARLSRSIGDLGSGGASLPARVVPWARPLQLAVGFALGGIVGAAIYGALRAPSVERVYIERPPVPVQLPVAGAEPEPAPSATPPTPSSKPAVLAASATADRNPSLAEQQALLDVARVAFAAGNYAQTLQTLANHAARFPKSVLAEEREALQIKALAASNRLAQARALAGRFQARHPQSLLLPSIKDSVGAIP
jgi:hypothetical protein